MKNIKSLKSIVLTPYSLLLLLFIASPIVANAQLQHSSKVTKSGVVNYFTITGGNSSSPSDASFVEYTHTKSIYSDGTVSKPSKIKTASFAFDGNYIFYRYNFGSYEKLRFAYHHSENGNSVYYQNGYSISSSGEGFSDEMAYNTALLVSADKKTINFIYNADDSSNRWYEVYKKGVDRSIGEMYE